MWPFWKRDEQPREPAPLPSNLHCSFCRKSQDEVRKLIAGPSDVYICDECIDLRNDIIADECEREAPAEPDEQPTAIYACPVCRLPRDRAEMLTVATDTLVCRPCALAVGAALAAEEEGPVSPPSST